MATQAPAATQCGTIYPIWMQGMFQFKKKISRIVLEKVLFGLVDCFTKVIWRIFIY